MKHLLPAIVLLGSTTAAAKPLPKDIKVALAKKKVMVTMKGVTVGIDDNTLPTDKLVSAELSDDGKSILVKRARCEGMFDDEEAAEFPLDAIEAKVENTLGMKLHTKKKYADAIPHFELAAKKDPATPLYATNLLSAQAMGGKLDDADKTIATYGKSQIPWFAWRLAVDPELKALKARPSAKLGPAKAGTAKGKLSDKLAYSPLGLVATEVNADIYDGDGSGPISTDFVIVDIATGKEVFRTSSSRKISDPLLATLGFDIVPGGLTALHEDKPITAADGRKLVTEPKLAVTAGKTSIDVQDKLTEQPWSAGFVPKALVVTTRHKDLEDCAGMGPRNFSVEIVPTP